MMIKRYVVAQIQVGHAGATLAVLANVEALRVLESVVAVGSGSLAANSSHSTSLRYCTCRHPLLNVLS